MGAQNVSFMAEPDNRLLRVAKTGSVPELQEYLAGCPQHLNQVFEWKRHHGRTTREEFLISSVDSYRSPKAEYCTFLAYACEHDLQDIVEYLLSLPNIDL